MQFLGIFFRHSESAKYFRLQPVDLSRFVPVSRIVLKHTDFSQKLHHRSIFSYKFKTFDNAVSFRKLRIVRDRLFTLFDRV